EKASGHFEVQEYRKPEFEVTVSSPDRFVVQGGQTTASITARYYFGQPVANGIVKYIVYKQPYYSPLRWGDDSDEEGGNWWGGGEQASEQTTRLDEKGTATVTIPVAKQVTLNLGDVAASAAVRVNGQLAGIRMAPPWVVDITQAVKSGENRIEVQVCNTLANHYTTIPTRYRGSTVSGLLGPVTLSI
ncbi:MAG: hypothetical protein NTW03_02115, partial [Verrucomicrobia bacterium]|nr:hypothetical protein [Verrucomicrobiota bacterium]